MEKPKRTDTTKDEIQLLIIGVISTALACGVMGSPHIKNGQAYLIAILLVVAAAASFFTAFFLAGTNQRAEVHT